MTGSADDHNARITYRDLSEPFGFSTADWIAVIDGSLAAVRLDHPGSALSLPPRLTWLTFPVKNPTLAHEAIMSIVKYSQTP